MKNKLQVNAAMCDVRKVQEETLAAYEHAQINGALLISNARARALFTKYHTDINCASTVDCEDDVSVSIANGKTIISGANVPSGKQYLVVNGQVTVTPDAGDTLRQYIGIAVNGELLCPDNLSVLAAGLITVNGRTAIYPAQAVILESRFALDRSFALRAQERLYWAAKRITAIDPDIDCAKLAAKGARFESPKALLCEEKAEELAPLFTEKTDIEILPAGTRYIDDDIQLTPAALRRCGGRIYVNGDVEIKPECAGLLGEIKALTVKGDILLPAAAEDELLSIPQLKYDGIKTYKGRLLASRDKLTITADMLEQSPDGLTCCDCSKVLIAPQAEPDMIAKRLVLDGCAKVVCSKRQQGAVAFASRDVSKIDADEDGDKDEQDSNTRVICAAMYVL